MSKILVIAPHPDDEILGVGGTIAKFSNSKNQVYVVILTKVYPPDFDPAISIQGQKEALKAHKVLGVTKTFFLDFPVLSLSLISPVKLNNALLKIIKKVKPAKMFVPFPGDIHDDHQKTFFSSLVCARPNIPDPPDEIYAYETLSETNWNAPYLTPSFCPNVFINIERTLAKKIQAMQKYKSQLKRFPHERSIISIKNLARFRGSTVHLHAAESFVLIRKIDKKPF